jgi:chromosome segregation ATPase
VQAQNSIAIASSEISSLKQSLEDKQELACFLTQESATLEKSYSETKTIVDLNNAKLKTLIEEKEKLEMQFCQIQKMTTESIMSEQGKLSCKNNELSSYKDFVSELVAEIMEEKVTMENLICVIEALHHTISDDNNENEDSDDRCVYDVVKTVSTINQEKDNKIKILQAHAEAMKCSLKIEEENSQKLWEVISSLELSLNESTSKAEDMSNKVSLLQTLVIDKNDELMR